MDIKIHRQNGRQIAEILSDGVVIASAEEALDIMGTLYFQRFDKIILFQKNLSEDFFDLENGMAGEILQKFSNYRMQLSIVGDFSGYTRKSVRDFIYESNQGLQVNFVGTVAEALR